MDAQGRALTHGWWFDPATRSLSPATDLPLSPRVAGSATVLSDGRVFFAGGWSTLSNGMPPAEIWNPRTNAYEIVTNPLTPARLGQSAVLLPNGTVRLNGGFDLMGHPVAAATVFDPRTQQFRSVTAVAAVASDGGLANPKLMASSPNANAVDFPADGILSLRFSEPMDPHTLNAQTITLLGPGGQTPIKVVGVEGGRLAFIAPARDLFPGAHYTLFMQGVMSQRRSTMMFVAIDFLVASVQASGKAALSVQPKGGVAVPTSAASLAAGMVGLLSPSSGTLVSSPLRVMTGAGISNAVATGPCTARITTQVMLCRPHSYFEDGAWYPGQDVAGAAGHAHWRANMPEMTPQEIAHIALLRRRHSGRGLAGVSGRIALVDGTPVANVDVSIGSAHVRTDIHGDFVLQGVSSGRQVLYVDGSTADSAGHEYGQFLAGVDLKTGLVTPLPYRMYLPRILARDKIELPSPTTRDMIVMQPDMPGLEIFIPAGTVIHDRKGKVVTELAIVPTPTDRSPVLTPLNFPVYFSLQPGGATVQNIDPHQTQGITLTYPNYDHVPAGTPGDFIAYSPEVGWQHYGKGKITPDGAQLKPAVGVHLETLTSASWAEGDANPGDAKPAKPNGPCCADPVDLGSGTLTEAQVDVTINDVIPLQLVRYWHAINSQVLLNAAATSETRMFGGWRSNFDSFVYSPSRSWTDPGQGVRLPNGYLLAPFSSITPRLGVAQSWVYSGSETQYIGAVLNAPYSPSDCNNPDGSECYYLQTRDGTQYWYDDFNGLYLIRDRFGNEVSLAKNGGLVQQVTSPSGRYLSFTYNANNNVQSVVDNSGRTWAYNYHTDTVPVAGWAADGSSPPPASGNSATIAFLDKVTYPDSTTGQFTYNENFSAPVATSGTKGQVSVSSCPYYPVPGTLSTMVDRDGHTTASNTYCSLEVVKQTLADGSNFTFAYQQDSNDNTTSTTVTDPVGNATVTNFDPVSGYPASVARASGTPLAQTTTYTRESSGLVDSVTDALGRTNSYTYDSRGNVLTHNLTGLAGTPSSVTEQFTWTPDYNQIATYQDGLGHTTTFTYTNGCLTQVADPLGNTTTITCSPSGQPLTVTDALNHATTFSYQAYDLQAVTDALGRVTTFTTDPLGRQVAVADPAGNISRRTYDPNNDWVNTFVDPMGNTTAIQHDAMGNVQSVTLPPTAGSLTGGTISYQYNARNWLKQRTDALNQSESWTYDGTGDVLTRTDRKSQLTQYSYDALGRLSQTTYADGSNVITTYDVGNRIIELNDSINGIQQFAWNGLNELTQQVSPQGTVSYQYDAAGRRQSMVAGVQAQVNYTYDNANRLTALAQGSTGLTRTFDNANRLQQLTLPNGVTETYGYDNANEVTGIAYAQGNGTSLGNLAYTYDTVGRRVSQIGTFASDTLPTATSQAGTFDLNNRQTSYNGTTLQYDANGNVTSDGVRTYAWNARNQLTQIQQGSTVVASFTYDAMGRRQSKSLNGGTVTTYLYDGATPVLETQGGTVTPILTGLGVDQYFARPEATGAAYFLTDAQGSTIGLTDGGGNLVQQYQYSPYGKVTASNTGTSNPYQYTGRENDGGGLYYYRARYYSTTMKRFLSEDPMGFAGGQNDFYAYVGGNPLSYIDPFGLQDSIGKQERDNAIQFAVNEASAVVLTDAEGAVSDVGVPAAALPGAVGSVIRSMAQSDCKEYMQDGTHEYPRFNDMNWSDYPNFSVAWGAYLKKHL
ncbi:RHS repeat-associated core domain-containing protein [Dyella agri]|uniref:Ig-like domain-containing protein n=1 Tax=Dyella agri TaxID=1926869 RepID=A0ABW8KI33_9GAMM